MQFSFDQFLVVLDAFAGALKASFPAEKQTALKFNQKPMLEIKLVVVNMTAGWLVGWCSPI